jgi:hypothetical protein
MVRWGTRWRLIVEERLIGAGLSMVAVARRRGSSVLGRRSGR